MRKFFLAVATLSLMAGCSSSSSDTPAPSETPSPSTNEQAEQAPQSTASENRGSIAVIRNLPSDDHTTQFLAGAVSEGNALGYTVDTFISNGDDARFQELVAQQIEKGYDGLIISHGKAEYSTQMLEPALAKGMEIVAFDTAFADNIIPDGITSTAQDDEALAKLSLDEIIANTENSPARILKIWYGPGVPPLDSRQVIYKEYEDAGLIETLEWIGPSTLDNVQGEVADRVAAVLPKYPAGTVDAMWGSWDEMAKGGYSALKEAGRTDINLVSIDVSNQDINLMMEEGSVWTATAAVDPHMIGTVSARILVNKLIGEPTPETYNFEAQIIRKSQLNDDTTMSTLSEVVEGWGASDAFSDTLAGLR
ncbi:MAG: ABC transporter substrate-binding protein [Epulopiscium sp. Nuni2H_MBin003]|nr:MAG: ABC transporter substrate-binding protein [Epulopiscium sp. Nuni2H_MBin003]